MYDSIAVDPLSPLFERSKVILEENANYSSQLEEFPTAYSGVYDRDSKMNFSRDGVFTESFYLSPGTNSDVQSPPFERLRHSEKAAAHVTSRNVNRGVNEVKTETFHSPGRFLSPKFASNPLAKNKENQIPALDFTQPNTLAAQTTPQKLPDTVRASVRYTGLMGDKSPMLLSDRSPMLLSDRSPMLSVLKSQKKRNLDSPFTTSPSIELGLDVNDIMKLKDPFFCIHINMMRYLVDELSFQERDLQKIFQIEQKKQGKQNTWKYYMIFSYNSAMEDDEAKDITDGFQAQLEEIQQGLDITNRTGTASTERLKFYLIFGNSTGWLVIKQTMVFNYEQKKLQIKTTKYNPSNLFFDSKFRSFESGLRKVSSEILSLSGELQVEHIQENGLTTRDKEVKFVTSWDSGLAVLGCVFKKFLEISRQKVTRPFLLFFLFEKYIRVDKQLNGSQISNSPPKHDGSYVDS